MIVSICSMIFSLPGHALSTGSSEVGGVLIRISSEGRCLHARGTWAGIYPRWKILRGKSITRAKLCQDLNALLREYDWPGCGLPLNSRHGQKKNENTRGRIRWP